MSIKVFVALMNLAIAGVCIAAYLFGGQTPLALFFGGMNFWCGFDSLIQELCKKN